MPAGKLSRSNNSVPKMGIFYQKKRNFQYFLFKNIDMNKNAVRNKSVPLGKKHEN